jgi:hypothetical protein
MPTAQAHERRVRREAHRQGLRLKKLRTGEGYWLIDISTGGLVLGEEITRGVRIGYELGAVEEWLK